MQGVTLLIVMLLQTLAHAFNLSPALILRGRDTQPGDYFGYSVALQRRTAPYGHWVIVGAPRANSSSQRTVVEPGVAYECNTETTEYCTPIELEKPVYLSGDSRDSKVIYKHKEDNAWIGGSVDVQEGSDGRIVVCGHRGVNHMINRTRVPVDEVYRMIGVCYVKDLATSATTAECLTPLNDRGKFTSNLETSIPGKNSTVKSRAHFYELGAAGISVHFVEDTNELLIGAPGLLQWRGTMIKYLSTSQNGNGNRMYGSPLTPHPGQTPKLTNDGYFGYSVDSGALYTKNSRSYVGGAPRAAALKGKVFVFDFPELGKSNFSEFKILAEIEGTQMGEYFGAAVCAVDLDGDGLDDLVVGAPTYTVPLSYPSQSRSSEGRVYVFLNRGQGIFSATKNSILGSHFNGRFGSAISKIGDVNNDGYNDIAVGAPFDHVDGHGAIYIYHGGSSGIDSKHRQQITAESVSTGLSGFGVSISRGLDVDGNGYNDIVVGAYRSGHVVLLTSRVVVTLRPTLGVKSSNGDSTSDQFIEKTATGFTVTACLYYSGLTSPDTVYVHAKLTADPRTQFVDNDRRTKNTSFNTDLRRGETECKDVAVEITKPENLLTPLEIRMNFKLDTSKGLNNSLGFCTGCPVVDPNALDYAVLSLPFVTERAELKIEASFLDPKAVVILGTQPRLPMSITVTNNGEPAFRTMIKVTLPVDTALLEFGGSRWTKHQNITHTTLEGDLQDIGIADFKVEELWVTLDTMGVKEGTPSLLFVVEVASSGVELTPSDNMAAVSLATKMEADVFVYAITNQIHETISASERQNFSHTYIVRNFGPSILSVLKVTIRLPITLKTSDGEIQLVQVYKPESTLDNQPVQCAHSEGPDFTPDEDEGVLENAQARSMPKRSTSDDPTVGSDVTRFPPGRTLVVDCSSEDAGCLTVECTAGPFAPNRSTAIISFRMQVDFKNIGPVMAERDILVLSSIGRVTLQSAETSQPAEHRPDVSTASTVFFGEKPSSHVDETVIYGAVAGGALILLVVIVVCWMVGFFKRPQKEELNAQQNEVEL